MRKKFTSVFFSFIFAFAIISSSYVSTYNVQASSVAQSLIDKLTYYVLTTTGALNAGINGVTQATATAISALQEKIADLWGNGIYEDGAGNYVFSGTASKEILETITGSTNLNARVISSFPGITPYGGIYGSDSPYFNPNVRSKLNTYRSIYTDYLCIGSFAKGSNNFYYSGCLFVDLTNIAYIVPSSSGTDIRLFFYNDAGQNINCNMTYYYGEYSYSNFSVGREGTTNSNFADLYFNSWNSSISRMTYHNIYYNENGLTTFSSSYGFDSFPFISNNQCICWSNKSIIIGLDSAHGNVEANKQSGTFVSNTYNIIPSVKKTVIENNNWQKIYYDYTQNVNNESNTFISNDTLNPDILRKVMKKYNKVITDAIEDGTQDIENAISTTNEWLKKIYERLGEISAKLDNLDGGDSSAGSGCVWTQEDITAIKNALTRIDSNMALELAESQKIYTFLGQILTAINNINVDGGRDITTIIPIITNLPDSDVLDFIDSGDVLADLMSSVVPFCFVGFALGLSETLSSEPVTPRWVIPLRLNSTTTGLNVNEELVIDFSEYEQSGFGFIHDLLIAGQCILFILALIWLTFNLLESFNIIFG